MKQARSEARKLAKAKRKAKAVELQCALEDRRAALAVMRELAELVRSSTRWAARLTVEVKPKPPSTRTSPVRKRAGTTRTSYVETTSLTSSWAIDDQGLRGIVWQQSYLRRGTDAFHRGAAREHWDYVVRDEAVLLDASGEPVIIDNMGDDWVEIGCAWQAIEDASTRKNAKIQIRAVVPLDADLSREEMIAAVGYFGETILAPLGLPYSAVIHRPPDGGDDRNFHAHILFSLRPMRRIEPYCWEVADGVCGELDGRDGVQALRHLWAHSMTAAAEQARSDRSYTGLGYGARGLDLEAGEHLGEDRSAMVRRGTTVWAHEQNQIKAARNAARLAIRDADRKIAALTTVRDAALARIAADQGTERRTRILSPSRPAMTAAPLAAAPSARPAARLVSTDLAVPAHQRQIASVPLPVRRQILRPSTMAKGQDQHMPSIPSSLPDLAASLHASTPSERRPADLVTPGMAIDRIRLVTSTTAPSRPKTALVPAAAVAPVDMFDRQRKELLRLLAEARIARRKKQAVLEAERRSTRPATARPPVRSRLSSPPTLADVPRRDRLEAQALERGGVPEPVGDRIDHALLDRLVRLDPYVMAYDDGVLEIAPDMLKSLGLDAALSRSSSVQDALARIRADQQAIVGALKREAASRPLDFARSGSRFWPRDLDPEHLRRLDRWASDPGFEQDIVPLELAVNRALEKYQRQGPRGDIRGEDPTAGPARPIADGFGGRRDTPAPHFGDVGTGIRLDAFDARGERPSDHLLLLLKLAGEHPRTIDFASDGRLMATGGPPIMASLLHGWRADKRVADLVTATVRLSRDAGRPSWPPEIAAAVRAYAARGAVSAAGPAPDHGRDPTR